MEKFTVTVEDMAGTRLDAYLAAVTDNNLSRSYIQKLMEKESVFVNGKAETLKKYKVKEGDILEINIPEPESAEAEAENIPIEIVYEDDDVVVINKPKGMVVHPAPGNEKGTVVNALLYHCSNLSSIGGVVRPGIVHRIDKNTSGLLMVAKNDAAHISLSDQLREHSITRVYKAIVYNNIKEDEGTVDAPIGRNPKNRFCMGVVPDGRRAVTHYKVLERFGNYTSVECRLETGRTHQIRVHMSYIKHPLLGDEVYGPSSRRSPADTQMLHAGTLGFVHPGTGEYMEFSSPLPEEFEKILTRLRTGHL